MDKVFALVESIPAGRMNIIDNLSFDEVKQVVHKYADTHTCKLFGVEVCTLHGIVLLAKELPLCTVTPNLGHFHEDKVADYHDRSRTWYTFSGKSRAKYSLTVYAIQPTEKAPRNVCPAEHNSAEAEFEDLLAFVTLGTGCLDSFSEEAIIHYYENDAIDKQLEVEREEFDAMLDSSDPDEIVPTTEENVRHFAVLEKAEEIIRKRREGGTNS